MMNKVMTIAVFCLMILMPTMAHAELRLVDTDSNGYKTYFDTDQIQVADDIIYVRVVGVDPSGNKILDIIERFKGSDDGNDILFSYQVNNGYSDWRSIQEVPAQMKIFKALYDYAMEK